MPPHNLSHQKSVFLQQADDLSQDKFEHGFSTRSAVVRFCCCFNNVALTKDKTTCKGSGQNTWNKPTIISPQTTEGKFNSPVIVQRQVIPSINKMARYRFHPRANRINNAPENKLTWHKINNSFSFSQTNPIFASVFILGFTVNSAQHGHLWGRHLKVSVLEKCLS